MRIKAKALISRISLASSSEDFCTSQFRSCWLLWWDLASSLFSGRSIGQKARYSFKSPEIPPELVHPTITEVANERVQVIQQRIMARDNLMAVVNKYDLFPRERQWMSGTELLDLLRSRMDIKPVDLDARTAVPGNPTIAFNLSFDYEVPTSPCRWRTSF